MDLDTIIYSGETAKKYQVTLEEKRFLFRLVSSLREAHKDTQLQIYRMANGALSVYSSRAYLGKIKLQGKMTWMQYPKGNDTKDAEDKTLDEYFQLLKHWVKYA